MSEVPDTWLVEQRPADDEVLYVDVNGYEGPLDLLLDLARRQKVDLSRISVLALAEQYLGFIETVREKRIEIAADYLVMAAWLAYLKSRLMVPAAPSDDEPTGEMMAALLQFRLKRLEAMRKAAMQLVNQPRLGRQVFARGMPEPVMIERRNLWEATLYDLLKAYAERRQKKMRRQTYTPRRHPTWSIKEARNALERLVGVMDDWGTFDRWLAEYMETPGMRRSVTASTFTATLELAREGLLDLRQDGAYAPIYIKRRADAA